jgi:hypothetical protein
MHLAFIGYKGGVSYEFGYTVCAYAINCNEMASSTLVYGVCLARDTHSMIAYSLSHLADELCLSEDRSEQVQVLLRKNSFRRHLNEIVPKWEARGGLNADGDMPEAGPAWLRTHQLYKAGRIKIDAVSRDRSGSGVIKGLEEICDVLRRETTRSELDENATIRGIGHPTSRLPPG